MMLITMPTELMTAPTAMVTPKNRMIFPNPPLVPRFTMWSRGAPKIAVERARLTGTRNSSLAKKDP